MTLRLVLATHNAGKVAELRRILAGGDDSGGPLDVELLSAQDLALRDVDETGATFEDNALLKARAATAATGLACVADDSGLEVDALGGEPGVRSARYAGVHGDDAANLELVLRRMQDAEERAARFVCVAALAVPDGREWTVRGELAGNLTREPRGANGFGYDPIFVPEGLEHTTAELAPEDKDALSHRGRAFRALRPRIRALVEE